ncbi:MAG TPA: (2Fe-2S)-binding protein [Bacteroidales bacterium]|nr:(2Fe-2S)-binding protein [Bacteroidales bacterium]
MLKSEPVIAFKARNLKAVEDVQKETEAGTVCGSCNPVIEEILNEIMN